MKVRFFIPLIILLGILIFPAIKIISTDKEQTLTKPNRDFPNIVLQPLYKAIPGINSKELINDKPFLVNIFASWCLSCRAEHPFLMSLKEEEIIPIYGINWRDEDEKAKKFLEILGNPYSRIGIDKKSNAIIELGVSGAPETFLVSANNKILLHHKGPLTQQIFVEKFSPLIKKY